MCANYQIPRRRQTDASTGSSNPRKPVVRSPASDPSHNDAKSYTIVKEKPYKWHTDFVTGWIMSGGKENYTASDDSGRQASIPELVKAAEELRRRKPVMPRCVETSFRSAIKLRQAEIDAHMEEAEREGGEKWARLCAHLNFLRRLQDWQGYFSVSEERNLSGDWRQLHSD